MTLFMAITDVNFLNMFSVCNANGGQLTAFDEAFLLELYVLHGKWCLKLYYCID